MRRRGELRLIEQAIRQNWDITPKGRKDAMALVREVLADSDATPRELLRACSVAIAMNESDLLADEDAALLDRVKLLGKLFDTAVRAKWAGSIERDCA